MAHGLWVVTWHDCLDYLPVDDVLLVAAVPLDVGHGLVNTQDDVDIGGMGVARVDHLDVDGEHLPDLAGVDRGVDV